MPVWESMTESLTQRGNAPNHEVKQYKETPKEREEPFPQAWPSTPPDHSDNEASAIYGNVPTNPWAAMDPTLNYNSMALGGSNPFAAGLMLGNGGSATDGNIMGGQNPVSAPPMNATSTRFPFPVMPSPFGPSYVLPQLARNDTQEPPRMHAHNSPTK